MVSRSSVIEKLLGAFLLSGFVVWVVPFIKPTSVFSTSIIILALAGISYYLGKFLAGEMDRIALVIIGMIMAAVAVLFILTPVGSL